MVRLDGTGATAESLQVDRILSLILGAEPPRIGYTRTSVSRKSMPARKNAEAATAS